MKHNRFIRLLGVALLVVTLALALPLTAAARNRVPTINVYVKIFEDGSARVTQTWSGSFDEGTEMYIPIQNLGDMDITDFAVSDDKGSYENIGDWDVNAGFEEKARKCGIVTTDEGYELCFGISEYGDNFYSFSYTVTGLVGSYSDGEDGFLFQFINPGMSVFPSDVTLTIFAPDGVELSEENSGIWAFGYEGTILFNSGTVVAETDVPLDGTESSMIILLRLDSGICSPTRVSDISFEELKDNAFKGSNYEEKFDLFGFILTVLFAIVMIAMVGFFLYLAIWSSIQRSRTRRHMKNADFYRDIPCGGDLERSYAMAKAFGMSHAQSLLSAALLRMMSDGYITASPQVDTPKKMQLTFVKKPPEEEELLSKLYSALVKACPDGSDTATQDQIKRQITGHFSKFEAPLDTAEFRGRKALRVMGCYVKPEKSDQARYLRDLTPEGVAVLDQLAGFSNYIEEFTLMKERTTIEVALWKEYMVYATLLEAADKVMKELRKLAPCADPEVESFDNSLASFLILNSVINNSYRMAYAEAHHVNSSGGGGGSSFGGGGGFSGGGFGGGTR